MAKRAACVLLIGGLAACSALDVSDPTKIQGTSLDNPIGAQDLWSIARASFFSAAAASAFYDGIMTDEFFVDATSSSTTDIAYTNRRESVLLEGRVGATNYHGFLQWQTVRSTATLAIPRVRAYSPAGARGAQLGELFALRGFAALRLAESFCPGFPLREIKNYQPVYGPPRTTAEAFTDAVAEFDSALVYATDSARVLNLARIGKARALLGLGYFAQASVLAAAVPAGYEERGFSTDQTFTYYFADWWDEVVSVADREGGTGLDFVSAADPRIEMQTIRNAHNGDTLTVLYASTKYLTDYPSMVVANDVEARLIEAEAALNAHDGAWLTILNDLRQNNITPALPSLSDPGTFDAQVDLLFRERAFWLFASGHRLGDMRRLIHQYGRAPETVFPTGPYRPSGTYGTATSLPFNPQREVTANPAVTGCTER